MHSSSVVVGHFDHLLIYAKTPTPWGAGVSHVVPPKFRNAARCDTLRR
ncbi:MAG: hypothetical protein SWK90_04300 [Chloroflexota bacterium]|nr:hypothetical protein [Chloroflexota bacterium]